MSEHHHKVDYWAGLRTLVLTIAVLALVLVVVAKYQKQIARVDWWLVMYFIVFSTVVLTLYRWNSGSDNKYDASDLVMTGGKADLWKHMVVLFGSIAAWVLVQSTLKGTLTTEMLSIILGIFVGKEAVGQIAVAIQTRPPASPSSPQVQVIAPNAQNVAGQQDAPAVAPAAPAAPVAPETPPPGHPYCG